MTLQLSFCSEVLMYKDNMLSSLRERLVSLQKNLQLVSTQNDPENVHQLRLDLKRARAFYRLTEAIDPGFNSRKQFKKLRAIARKSSTLRDSHVQYELAVSLARAIKMSLPEYENYLSGEEIRGWKELREHIAQSDEPRIAKRILSIDKILAVIPEKRASQAIRFKLENLLNHMVGLTRESHSGEELLHQVRISSKEMQYTLEFAAQSFAGFPDNSSYMEEIKKVHKVLGKWHDLLVCQQYIEFFLKEKLQEKQDIRYSLFLGLVKKEKNLLVRKFHLSFAKFQQLSPRII